MSPPDWSRKSECNWSVSMPEWRIMRVAEIAAVKGLVGGPFGSSLGSKDYVAIGVPVIRGANLGSDGEFHSREFVFVTEEKVENELSRNLAIPGDVIFTQRGTLGQVGIVPKSGFERYVISQSQMRLRVNRTMAEPRFVYYQFKSPKMITEIHNHAITTGVPHINLAILGDLSIVLPPLPIQRAIIDLLGALDDKIAANGRTIRVSFNLAEARYKLLSARATSPRLVTDLLDLKYGKALPTGQRVPGDISVYGSGGQTGRHDQALVSGPGVIVGRKGTVGAIYWSEDDFFPIDTTFYV
ncbi:MAG: restriction endonuclease subunit S, partial [Streptosporangiaceae bacterium]